MVADLTNTMYEFIKDRPLFYDVYFVFDADIDDVVNEATTFIGLCNGIEAGSTMSEKRYLFHERLLQQ